MRMTAGIHDMIYPPVGPNSIPGPPMAPENTGRPVRPRRIYTPMVNTACLGVRSSAIRLTTRVWAVRLAGVNGSGMTM